MEKYIHELTTKGQAAKQTARKLAIMSTTVKNQALLAMANALQENESAILTANQTDIDAGRQKGLSEAMLERLLLNESRINAMAEGLRQVAALPDPIGEVLTMQHRPNGLDIGKMRVPLGVIGIVYESRPNVTVDAAGLCLKSGNACILRGGSEAINSNKAIASVLVAAAEKNGIPSGAINLVETTDREAVNALLKLNAYLDVIIPRGGAGLIKAVVENSTVPVIETGSGVCHTYVDSAVDIEMARRVVFNAKVSRPSVCNAMETLLVHKDIAPELLPIVVGDCTEAKVELRGCRKMLELFPNMKMATDEDWSTEYSDLILSIKIVNDMDEALDHIAQYGTRHSEAILTSIYNNGRRFLQAVDAAAVYVNASTRFTDGFEFGFGAEIGISTQKMHARGPMGLNELTSSKYVIFGDGQIR